MSRNENVYVNVGSAANAEQQAAESATANSSIKAPEERYSGVVYCVGIAEFIVGLLFFILGIITLGIASANTGSSPYLYRSANYNYYDHAWMYFAQGIWGGVFAIVVGILGVKVRSNPSKCMYNANMVSSIIGALVMGASTVLSWIAAGKASYRLHNLVVVNLVLVILGINGLGMMIIHFAYCCAGVCCRSNQEAAVSYYPSPARMQQPQLIQLANGQHPTGKHSLPHNLYNKFLYLLDLRNIISNRRK